MGAAKSNELMVTVRFREVPLYVRIYYIIAIYDQLSVHMCMRFASESLFNYYYIKH